MPRNQTAAAAEPRPMMMDDHRRELVIAYRQRLAASKLSRLSPATLTREQMQILIDNPSYSKANNHYAGLWRSSADEATPPSPFPPALQVLPEVYDGAIGQGEAAHVYTNIVRVDERTGILTVRDTGKGIQNTLRLKQWAAYESVSNIHRNGHGLKKSITKFAPDYETAVWSIRWRLAGDMGIQEIRYPFVGVDTPIKEGRGKPDEVFPSGTEITVVFEWERLGEYRTAKDILAALKEIIRTRYSEDKLRACRFNFLIQDEAGVVAEDSHAPDAPWHSFEHHLHEAIRRGNVELKMPKFTSELPVSKAPYELTWFELGRTNEIDALGFPNYGKRNKECALVHVKLNGRMIETIPFIKFMKTKGRNQDTFNGNIVIVNFTSPDHTKMPSPCTTKVSLNQDTAIYKEWFLAMQETLNRPLALPPPPAEPRKNVTKDVIEKGLGLNFRFNGETLEVQFRDTWIPASEFRARLTTSTA